MDVLDIRDATTDWNRPQAFLNYLVFDEEFNYDQLASGAVQIGGTDNAWEQVSLPSDLTISQNGYILIYLSNEETMDVFFDDINITHENGRLLEEQHYYPHGLLIKHMASSGSGPENRYMYQGKEMQPELGMQLYDFHARQYDPQLGRFWGVDPMEQFPSGYTGMGNDPANDIDPTGMLATGATPNGGGAGTAQASFYDPYVTGVVEITLGFETPKSKSGTGGQTQAPVDQGKRAQQGRSSNSGIGMNMTSVDRHLANDVFNPQHNELAYQYYWEHGGSEEFDESGYSTIKRG